MPNFAEAQLSSSESPAVHKRMLTVHREASNANSPCVPLVNHVTAGAVDRMLVGKVKAYVTRRPASEAIIHQPTLPINGSEDPEAEGRASIRAMTIASMPEGAGRLPIS